MKYYFLDQDSSCHWYIIPVDKREEWNEWSNINEDDPRAWDAPEWAKMLGGGISQVEFLLPEGEYNKL